MTKGEATQTMQFLTFKLADELFALDISQVREVLDYTPVTRVPQTPRFMKGVINLRGNVVPVVDLRTKFALPEHDHPEQSCIIVVEVTMEGEVTVLGALADSVQEVLDLEAERIEPAPRIGTQLKSGFVKGMGKQEDRLIIILDIDRVFSLDELSLVQEVALDQVGEPVAMAG
jgi:purine-binding chemotaxis protein CheW